MLDALDLDLGVAVPSSLVLRGTDLRPANAPIDFGDLNATVGGAVQVRKAPGEKFRLTGEVNTVRGSYTFQGRRFDILRDGRIRFAGTEDIDPQLDLRARRLISGVEVFVRVQGTHARARAVVHQQPAAGSGGHPVADRLQHADQRAWRRAADLAGRARRRAGRRLPRVGADALDRRRAGARRVRNPGAGRAGRSGRRSASASRWASGCSSGSARASAPSRRPSSSSNIRLPTSSACRARWRRPRAARSARRFRRIERGWARSDLLLQLLTLNHDGATVTTIASCRRVRRGFFRESVYAFSTCTRASLKHAPPPRSVSASDTSALVV